MHENEHLRLIEEMCAQVGIQESAEVVRTRHVMVDGTVVGLGVAPQGRQGMPLFFDFGAMPHEGIERTLLKINAAKGMADGDCFALHPDTGAVLFRSHAPVTAHASGSELASTIQQSLVRGRGLLEAGMQGIAQESGVPA